MRRAELEDVVSLTLLAIWTYTLTKIDDDDEEEEEGRTGRCCLSNIGDMNANTEEDWGQHDKLSFNIKASFRI